MPSGEKEQYRAPSICETDTGSDRSPQCHTRTNLTEKKIIFQPNTVKKKSYDQPPNPCAANKGVSR